MIFKLLSIKNSQVQLSVESAFDKILDAGYQRRLLRVQGSSKEFFLGLNQFAIANPTVLSNVKIERSQGYFRSMLRSFCCILNVFLNKEGVCVDTKTFGQSVSRWVRDSLTYPKLKLANNNEACKLVYGHLCVFFGIPVFFKMCMVALLGVFKVYN